LIAFNASICLVAPGATDGIETVGERTPRPSMGAAAAN